MCLASCSFVTKDFDTSDKDDLVIQLITYVLDQAHYLDKEIDDEFSEDVFNTFLENLDPFKRYFYKSDIDEFSKYKYSIDDAFKNPDLEFFELVYGFSGAWSVYPFHESRNIIISDIQNGLFVVKREN